MKTFKILISFLAITFLSANCALIGDLSGDSSTDTTTTTTTDTTPTVTLNSEGSTSFPYLVTYFTDHAGSVDGVNSSYYVYYAAFYSTAYSWTIYNLDADADLRCYNGGNQFLYGFDDSSTLGGTSSDSCISYTGVTYNDIYAEVVPYVSGGATYDIYVY